jgi:hypothetical protein
MRELVKGDIVIQKNLNNIQQAGEGILDNWRWVILDGECVSFDDKARCSIAFLKMSDYEIIGNISKLLKG